MTEDEESETIVCVMCGEESDSYVSNGFDLGDLCEYCADITTEEYSL